MNIEISKIRTGKRIRQDLGDISELAESILQYGLLCPIILRRINDDSYKLLAGNRRLKACKKLNKTTVEAVVLRQ